MHEPRSSVLIVNFEHISHLVLVFLRLTLDIQLPAGLHDFKKMIGFKKLFSYLSQKTNTVISILLNKLFLCDILIEWWWLEMGRLVTNLWNKKTLGYIRFNLTHFGHISNSFSIAGK